MKEYKNEQLWADHGPHSPAQLRGKEVAEGRLRRRCFNLLLILTALVC